MYPSVKTLMTIKDVTRADALRIRAIMKGEEPPRCAGCGNWPIAGTICRHYHDGRHRPSRMAAIDQVLHTFGVEHIVAGHNSKSPAITYCNAGDSYAATILKVNGRFRVGCWGDIVERGNYD